MSNLLKCIENIRNKIIKQEGSIKKYKLIKSFQETSMEDKTLSSPYFRVFQPVKPEEDRKINIFSNIYFQYHKDTLLDYPSIIQHKIGGEWSLYNRLISIHVPCCTFYCWHCYNDKKLFSEDNADFITAEEIIKKFLEQRTKDQDNNINTNVLRITGGEPFLLPEFILECLEILRNERRSDEVFIWTETNLTPFIAFNNQKSLIDLWGHLPQLAKYNNLAVHPCLHGLNSDNIAHVTFRKEFGLEIDHLLAGLKKLLDNKIDIYPTFASNICPPEEVDNLFKRLYNLNKLLPLRFALIEMKLSYKEIVERFKTFEGKERKPILYSKFSNLKLWNDLLEKHYKVGYAVIPRHLVDIYREKSFIKCCELAIDNFAKPNSEIIHVFKSSFRPEYHKEILDIITLPEEFIYKLEYDKKYIQKDLFYHSEFNPNYYENKDALLIYVDIDNKEKRYCPLRKIKIIKFEIAGEVFVLYFQLKKLVSLENSEKLQNIQLELEKFYGSSVLPPGGQYIFLGEDIFEYEENNHITIWQKIINLLIKYKKFKTSLFYRLEPFNISLISSSDETPSSEFEIKGGKKFSFKVHFYLPNYENFDRNKPDLRKVKVDTSNNNVQIIGPKEFWISKYGSKEIHFRTKKVLDDIQVNIMFWSEEKRLEAPELSLPVLIKGEKREVTRKNVLSKLGLFFGTGLIAYFSGYHIPAGISWLNFLIFFGGGALLYCLSAKLEMDIINIKTR